MCLPSALQRVFAGLPVTCRLWMGGGHAPRPGHHQPPPGAILVCQQAGMSATVAVCMGLRLRCRHPPARRCIYLFLAVYLPTYLPM